MMTRRSVTEKVYQKIRYGEVFSLGPVECQVLVNCSEYGVGNNYEPAGEIAERAEFSHRRTIDALERLERKGYTESLRPFNDNCVIWGRSEKGEKIVQALCSRESV
jgi:DNA-binding MarR family transcriptional regulator